MTREVAWKPRWAMIRLVNSWARSTFDISSWPAITAPRPFRPGAPHEATPVVGGLLVSADLWGSTWRPVFLLNVPIGAALLIAGSRLLPRGRGEPGRGLDPAGLGATSLSGQVVVAQLRVALVDLLEGLGFDHDRAREALPTLHS